MDRRAIIEEAAGITMYKTKRRLAEAKLEASKVNLSRIHDILVEVEKQLASLEAASVEGAALCGAARTDARVCCGSCWRARREHLDIEAVRLRDVVAGHGNGGIARGAIAVHELEAEQERLSDAELRAGWRAAADAELAGPDGAGLDRAENRITFNHEQMAQIESREMRAGGLRLEAGGADSGGPEHAHGGTSRSGGGAARADGERWKRLCVKTRSRLRRRWRNSRQLDATHRGTAHACGAAGARIRRASRRNRCRRRKRRRGTQRRKNNERQRCARWKSECARLPRKLRRRKRRCRGGSERADSWARRCAMRRRDWRNCAGESAGNAGSNWRRCARRFPAERARQASIEQILSERAYTADAVQKLFNVSGDATAPMRRAARVSARWACWRITRKCRKSTKAAIEQFLRDELEYVVVESFDQARAGVSLLRDEMGGRATFFVDSLNKLNLADAGS